MASNPTRAVCFARKSTEDRPNLPNIQSQLDRTRAYAEEQGWAVVDEIREEDVSGALAYRERPGIRRLFDMARRGEVDIVVFTEVDRFARDQKEAMRILLDADELGFDIHIAEFRRKLDPFAGYEGVSDNVYLAGAQDERRRIKRRMVRGRQQGLATGKWPGGPCPAGYRLDEEKRLVIDEPMAEVVRAAFALARDPRYGSVIAVTAELQTRPTPVRITKSRIWALLRDPIYAGRGRTITMGGKNAKGEDLGVPEETYTIPAPAIIPEDEFEAVQKILADRRLAYSANYSGKRVYPLSGRIAHVHPDGAVYGMGGESPGGRRQGEVLYRCQGAKMRDCPGTTPDAPRYRQRTSVDAFLVESYVIRLGLELLDNPNAIAAMADQATRERIAAPDGQATRAALEASLSALEGERTRALEAHRRSWADDDETAAAMDDIARRRTDLERDLADLDRRQEPEALVAGLALIDLAGLVEDVLDPGVIGPDSPRWPAVLAGLRDEVEGFGPDRSTDDPPLSDWARGWASHVATTLGLTVVVEPDGRITATTDDPRMHRDASESSTGPG